MTPEIHLFILWQRARYNEEKILQDMEQHFCILKKYAITWTPPLVSSNFTRFYGVNLPPKSGKEKECGTGEFLLCVVRDDNPVYEERMTSRGIEVVNVNMFDAKTRYRQWTQGGHKVHGTNNEKETNHDLTLLIGQNVEDFLTDCKEPDPEVKRLQRDIEGANGWKSLRHLFYVLNNTISYVVLRNFESLPDKHDVSIHGDIDLLTEDKDNIRYITNGSPVFHESYRVYHHVPVGGQMIPFDFRYVGDNYYDKSWETDILTSRRIHNNTFYVPNGENQYYSLLYHAYIQKFTIAKDYPQKLQTFAEAINMQYKSGVADSIAQIDYFLQSHRYEYVRPYDKTVGFNADNLNLSKYYNRFGGECIRSVRNVVKDTVTKGLISYESKVFRKQNSFVKAGTPWLIDNEIRFLERIGDGVHFPKIIAKGGDNKEHWVEMSAIKGENLFNNRWSIRISNVRDYALRILNTLEILYNNNIIHRDIHSNNIYIDDNGCIGILDFGFAVDFRNDRHFPCPWNLGMTNSPKYMYSDFYNLAKLFEYRWEKMPFVQRFSSELKKIDWEHYQDTSFVTQQIAHAKECLNKRFTFEDLYEYLLGKYKVRKYACHPRRLLRRVTSNLDLKTPRRVVNKCMRILKKVASR